MRVEQRLWSSDSGWQPDSGSGTLGERAQLVLLFGGVEQVRASECFAWVRANYPRAHLVGCTTAGQIHGPRVLDETLSLTAISFAHTRIAMARARVDGVADSSAAGARLARALHGLDTRLRALRRFERECQ